MDHEIQRGPALQCCAGTWKKMRTKSSHYIVRMVTQFIARVLCTVTKDEGIQRNLSQKIPCGHSVGNQARPGIGEAGYIWDGALKIVCILVRLPHLWRHCLTDLLNTTVERTRKYHISISTERDFISLFTT